MPLGLRTPAVESGGSAWMAVLLGVKDFRKVVLVEAQTHSSPRKNVFLNFQG